MPSLVLARRGLLSGASQGDVARAVTGYSQYPTRAVANGSSFTQMQARKQIHLARNARSVSLTIGNVLATTAGSADVAMPDATVKMGLFDPATSVWYPFNFKGASSILLTSGQITDTDDLAIPPGAGGSFTEGKRFILIKYVTYATAPANFPAGSILAGGFDYNEWGNSLVDKTTSGSFTAARPMGNFDVFPALSINGKGDSRKVVVGILGDSISSDCANDTANDFLFGWVQEGLAAVGIPSVNIGITSLSLSAFLNTAYDARRANVYELLRRAKVTHVFCTLGTNDWAAGQTNAQLFANILILSAQLASMGIKLIPCTLQPRTNAANNAQNGSETVTFAQRALYNAAIIAGNGVGFGYYDVAAVTQNSGSPDFWRTDLLKLSSAAVAAGGTGYAVANDLFYFPGGVRLYAATVSGGAVATLTTRHVGGFAVAPSNPVSPLSSISNIIGGGVSLGSGFTVNYTTTAANQDTGDGIHPGPSHHANLKTDFETKAPLLFAA